MKIFLFVLLMVTINDCYGNGTPIAGSVVDHDTQEPLPFTTILIVGQNRGTVSNVEGSFVLGREGILDTDTIKFSYMGYQSFSILAGNLTENSTVSLKPSTVNLQEVQILSRELSAEEIVELVYDNFPKNHPTATHKQKLFYHRYERTPFPKENKINLKKTNFPGLDEKTFNELFEMIPDEFIEYHDAQVELYQNNDESKLIPIDGISLEEGSQKELQKEMEKKLSVFFEEMEKTKGEEDVYYKLRSGIFAGKINFDDDKDSIETELAKDSLNYHIEVNHIKNEIQNLQKDYADVESKNWSFINSTRKYNYKMEDITTFNDELVYKISFTPRSKGHFEGAMYITTNTYAILQLDFEYAEGKRTEKFQLLGIGHSMDSKRGNVIFEKVDSCYYMKYIYAEQHETASVERKLSIMKKKKRFLFDKELNEIKIDTELHFDINTYQELLVLNRESINSDQFKQLVQPKKMKFKKNYAYSPEAWTNSTVIAPTAELKKYKRK